MRAAITGWGGAFPSPRSAPSSHRSSTAPTSSPFPTPGSSRRSTVWWRRSTNAGRPERGANGVKADKVYLVGFMAARKTTVARALARRLGWEMVDVDEAIEQRERQTVADIFARKGEGYFRAVERQTILDQVPRRHLIVATGGGTFVDGQNRAAINADGVSVWLDVPLERLIDRVRPAGRRPLAADRAGFERLYYQRRAAYEQAHVRLDAGRAGVDALVEQLVDWLEH